MPQSYFLTIFYFVVIGTGVISIGYIIFDFSKRRIRKRKFERAVQDAEKSVKNNEENSKDKILAVFKTFTLADYAQDKGIQKKLNDLLEKPKYEEVRKNLLVQDPESESYVEMFDEWNEDYSVKIILKRMADDSGRAYEQYAATPISKTSLEKIPQHQERLQKHLTQILSKYNLQIPSNISLNNIQGLSELAGIMVSWEMISQRAYEFIKKAIDLIYQAQEEPLIVEEIDLQKAIKLLEVGISLIEINSKANIKVDENEVSLGVPSDFLESLGSEKASDTESFNNKTKNLGSSSEDE